MLYDPRATVEGRELLGGIFHLGCAVGDIAAASFYAKSFGAEPSGKEGVEDQGTVATIFSLGDPRIEIVRPSRPDSSVGEFLSSAARASTTSPTKFKISKRRSSG